MFLMLLSTISSGFHWNLHGLQFDLESIANGLLQGISNLFGMDFQWNPDAF